MLPNFVPQLIFPIFVQDFLSNELISQQKSLVFVNILGAKNPSTKTCKVSKLQAAKVSVFFGSFDLIFESGNPQCERWVAARNNPVWLAHLGEENLQIKEMSTLKGVYLQVEKKVSMFG